MKNKTTSFEKKKGENSSTKQETHTHTQKKKKNLSAHSLHIVFFSLKETKSNLLNHLHLRQKIDFEQVTNYFLNCFRQQIVDYY
jgi:hypothetical protein